MPQRNLSIYWEKYKRLVFHILKSYKTSQDYEDLCQEGFLAMCDALDNYDESKGTFSSFLVIYVRKAVRDYRFNSTTYHIPRNIYEIAKKYKGAETPGLEELMQENGITESEAQHVQIALDCLKATSLDKALPGDDGESGSLNDVVADATSDFENDVVDQVNNEELHTALDEVMETIPDSQSEIIKEHYYNDRSLSDIAREKNKSLQAVSVAEKNGIEAMRRPTNARKLRPFSDLYIYSHSLKGGFNSFNETWTSSTEKVALKLAERDANLTHV